MLMSSGKEGALGISQSEPHLLVRSWKPPWPPLLRRLHLLDRRGAARLLQISVATQTEGQPMATQAEGQPMATLSLYICPCIHVQRSAPSLPMPAGHGTMPLKPPLHVSPQASPSASCRKVALRMICSLACNQSGNSQQPGKVHETITEGLPAPQLRGKQGQGRRQSCHLHEQAQPAAAAAVVLHEDDHWLGRHALHAPVLDADAPCVHVADLVVRQRLRK